MSFAVTNFLPSLRILMDAWDASVTYRYPDTVLTGAVQAMVRLGKMNNSIYSANTGYTLSPDGGGIDPDWSGLPAPLQANLFALGTYQTCLIFLRSKPEKYSFRTRQLAESTGSLHRYVETMEADVHRLENGESLFTGYQSYYSWLTGIAGLPLGEVLAQFDVESPLWKATFTRDGFRVA